jgi:hypothetical protein
VPAGARSVVLTVFCRLGSVIAHDSILSNRMLKGAAS